VRRFYRDARENEEALIRSFQAVALGIRELKLHRGRRRDFMRRELLSTIALSQGESKRLALLTTLLEDRAIYVFDEWAADQDPGSGRCSTGRS
jgi:ABC-type siderophore export system fused ATPase/permease subunit